MTVQNKFNKYENDSLITEKCEQTVLACSIDAAIKGGADKVLTAWADVGGLRAVASDGQAAISGKLNVKAIYLTSEGELDSIDYLSDFSKTVACPSATEGATVIATAKVVDVQSAVEGDAIKMQTVVELCPTVVVHREYELLEEVEGAFVKRAQSEFSHFIGVVETDVETDEQYATGAVVEKVLAFDSKAHLIKVTADGAGALAEGEVCVTIVYQSDGKAVQKNMTLPFVQRIEGEEDAAYDVRAEVKDSKLVIGGSATENVFDVKVNATLSALISKSSTAELVTDVYCPTKELKLSRLCMSYADYCGTERTRERISGSVDVLTDGIGVGRIVAALEKDNSIATVDVKDGVATVDGVLAVCVIYKDDNEQYASADIDLPYSTEVDVAGSSDNVVIKVSSCEISAKVKRDSEIEVTATVCVSAGCADVKRVCAVDGIEEGADIKPCEDAISVYYAKKGETLWDIAKKLSLAPEVIAAQNPEIGETLEAGQNVVVYREVAV